MVPLRHGVLVLLLLVVISAGDGVVAVPVYRPPRQPVFYPAPAPDAASIEHHHGESKPLIERCTVHWRNATLDHFAFDTSSARVFHQRYFLCSEHWRPDDRGHPGPMFFYLGNEADVTLYLNATGLMWELAPHFGALLVFAEHRYYGQSKPFKEKELRSHMRYLSSSQALADYAELITELRDTLPHAKHAPVVGFGGSYGGMLAAWFRAKYPHILDGGAIAGSAPVWSFYGNEPPYDIGSYAKIITYAASPKAGSAKECVPNARKAWKALFDLSHKQEDRNVTREALRLCDDVPLDSVDDVWAAAYWMQSAWDYMAMGNFPYASSYILNGRGQLPAWPIRVACTKLAAHDLNATQLLSAMADAVGVFYNSSGQHKPCFDYRGSVNKETKEDGEFWSYQYCTEMFQPMERDGVHDMFWKQPFDEAAAIAECQQLWNVTPRPDWPTTHYGGSPHLEALSNIVFTNGRLDPWSGGGVLESRVRSVDAIVIEEAAHHLDLMFSHDGDSRAVKEARRTQLDRIERWIEEARRRYDEHEREHGRPSDNSGSGRSVI